MSVKSWPGGKGKMTSMTNKVKIMLWVCVVYILSSICYIPMMLQQHGASVPNGLSLLKYLFVCIPAASAFLFLAFEHRLKKYFATAFSGKIALKQIGTWAILMFAGLSVSFCYSLAARTDLLQNTYPSVTVLLSSCMYLFVTAFVEELAWRGFSLSRFLFREKTFAVSYWLGSFGQYGICLCGSLEIRWEPVRLFLSAFGRSLFLLSLESLIINAGIYCLLRYCTQPSTSVI